MLKLTPAATTQADSELCRNACGFYGNRIWDGFCSKCYRDVYQQAKQIQEAYDDKVGPTQSPDATPPSTVQSSPSFTNFHEKRRSNISMRNPLRQMVNRAGSLRSTSNSVIAAILNEEQSVEQEAASKHLDVMTTDDARLDIKSQVKNFGNNFNKKCSNKNISIDTLMHDYGQFKDTLKKRIQTNTIYRDENEDLVSRVRDYLEYIIFTRNYTLIFNRIAIACEEQDLSIQNRISSLHWITPGMLETVVNENLTAVREPLYKAINSLIELDSKTTPQDKIRSIMECKTFIEETIQASGSTGVTINADCFLPALIFVVLKAKPPRLHSNIKFLSSFSQPSGEQLYYLANLDSAVRFIELLQAQHLGLSSEDFNMYMRGEPVLPSSVVPLFDYPLTNSQEQRKLLTLYHDIDHHCEKFDGHLIDFRARITQSATDVHELLNGTYARFAHFDSIPQLVDLDNSNNEPLISTSTNNTSGKELKDILDQSTSEDDHLPEPLAPEVIQRTNS